MKIETIAARIIAMCRRRHDGHRYSPRANCTQKAPSITAQMPETHRCWMTSSVLIHSRQWSGIGCRSSTRFVPVESDIDGEALRRMMQEQQGDQHQGEYEENDGHPASTPKGREQQQEKAEEYPGGNHDSDGTQHMEALPAE